VDAGLTFLTGGVRNPVVRFGFRVLPFGLTEMVGHRLDETLTHVRVGIEASLEDFAEGFG